MVRRGLLPLYALIFLETLVLVALVPLAPTFADELSLSKFETGVLLAAAGFASVLVSLPIGLLADRLGARTMTVAGAVVFTLSTLAQGLAADFWSLLAARVVFGVAFGALWTAGVAWLADSSPRPRATAIGATVTTAGLGITAGPAFAGLLADRFDLGVPFFAAAGAGAVVTVALLIGEPGKTFPAERQPLLGALRLVRRDELVLASIALMVLLGFVTGGVNLLVPLELRSNGVSAGAIGLAFSASSAIYTAFSAVIARLGERAVTLRNAGGAALAFGLSIVLVLVSGSTAAAVGFILLRAPFWGAIDTLAYPLAAAGAHRTGAARGAVLGLLNLCWGAAATIGPLACGAIAQATGEGAAYGLMIAACIAAAVWMLGAERVRAGEPRLEGPGSG